MFRFALSFALLALVFASNCTVSDPDRVDCGHVGTTEQTCEAANCCWKPIDPNPNNYPWCFYPADHMPSPAPSPQPSQNGSFTPDETNTMQGFFLKNIDIGGQGGVVAAPDTATKGGSYYFGWMRDSSITYNVVLNVVSTAEDYLKKWVGWISKTQSETSPSGINVLGEPKFMLPNGEVFSGGWCRPQNDGAGLRANTLGNFAFKLLNESQESYVRSSIWGLMQAECNYVASVWQQSSQQCDLWEEIRGEMFFTLMVQRKGLLTCSKLATKLGDSASASKYSSAASAVQTAAAAHWNGNFIQEATNRQKDSAVILGILYGYADDDFLAYTDSKVVATVAVLNKVFTDMFPINAADNSAGIPGILWGRYLGDGYAGGNPWILNTAGLADLYFRQSAEIMKNAKANKFPSKETLKAFVPVLGEWVREVKESNMAVAHRLAVQLHGLGDGVLARIRYHVLPLGLHLPEQVDKNTGAFANAHDLTWSYGSVLLALHNRDVSLSML